MIRRSAMVLLVFAVLVSGCVSAEKREARDRVGELVVLALTHIPDTIGVHKDFKSVAIVTEDSGCGERLPSAILFNGGARTADAPLLESEAIAQSFEADGWAVKRMQEPYTNLAGDVGTMDWMRAHIGEDAITVRISLGVLNSILVYHSECLINNVDGSVSESVNAVVVDSF